MKSTFRISLAELLCRFFSFRFVIIGFLAASLILAYRRMNELDYLTKTKWVGSSQA
jgi:hypothetical protein